MTISSEALFSQAPRAGGQHCECPETDQGIMCECGGHCHHHGHTAKPHAQSKQTPVGKISSFVNFLRAQGLSVGIQETEDALKALTLVGFDDRDTVRTALKALFTGSKREQQVFDRCFDLYFVSTEEFEANQAAMIQAQQEYEARRRELEERLSVQGKPIDLREDLRDIHNGKATVYPRSCRGGCGAVGRQKTVDPHGTGFVYCP